MTLSTRLVQIAGAVEASEGVAETLDAADALSVYRPRYTPDIRKYNRNPVSQAYGRLPSIAGIQLARIAFDVELKGSGDVTVAPEFDVFLKACGYNTRSVVSTATIGAVSGGPFLPGELIEDDATQLITARVVGECANGDSVIYIVPIDGSFVGTEAITGRTSGATATLSGAPVADKGFEYKLNAADNPSLTIGRYLNGLRNLITGARGNVRISANQVGEPTFLSFDFLGAFNAPTDTPVLSGTAFQTTIPPVFKGVNFVIHEYDEVCIASYSNDLGNNLAVRTCANAPGGVSSIWISDRDVSGSIDPEMTLVGTHDWYGRHLNGTTGRASFKLGSAAGNTIWVYSPSVEYRRVTEGERDTIVTAEIEYGAVKADIDTGDDEIFLAFI